LLARGFKYDNGVALSPEGRLLIVEAQGLLWIDPADGKREWWIEELPGESPGDGFAFDVEGRLYCACPMDHCIRVFDRDAKQIDQIDLGPGAYPTNCCFGGADRCTLFTTELAPGASVRSRGCRAPDCHSRPGLRPETSARRPYQSRP
jgi:sugar lactone lactonase YvrE